MKLLVTVDGTVHSESCHYLESASRGTMEWDADWMEQDDKPCRACLPDGLPA